MKDYISYGQLRNTLVGVHEDGNAVPELAESWESTPDAKKWIFKLRKGVEFHNGKTLDADDVVFSTKRHWMEGSKASGKAYLSAVKDSITSNSVYLSL